MIRSELRDDHCWCGTSLDRATSVQREDVTYTAGEFRGEPGTVIIAECSCGITSVIPFSVDLRRVAA